MTKMKKFFKFGRFFSANLQTIPSGTWQKRDCKIFPYTMLKIGPKKTMQLATAFVAESFLKTIVNILGKEIGQKWEFLC
jgi:hypothetical protein